MADEGSASAAGSPAVPPLSVGPSPAQSVKSRMSVFSATSTMKSAFSKAKKRINQIGKRMGDVPLMEEEEVLRLLRRDIDDADLAEFWVNMTFEELTTWSLRELKIACAARRLEQFGRRLDLIDRLMQYKARDERDRERKRLISDLKDQREQEADGAVYCVGQGYDKSCRTWDRLYMRNNVVAIQALSGIGVKEVIMGFDSSISYALCTNGEIWSWGVLPANERGPVGYKRKLKYDQKTSTEDFPTLQHAEMTTSKIGTTFAGEKAKPHREPVRPRERDVRGTRFKHTRAAHGVPTEQRWLTEASVAKAEEVRKKDAMLARKARLRKRRERRRRLQVAGYHTDSDSDDFGEELFDGDNGVGAVDEDMDMPFPEERLREARDRPVIDTGAPGRRLAEQSGDRPPPAVDEGKSWLSLRLGILKGKLKGFAMDKLKHTKWAAKEQAYRERQQKMADQYKRKHGSAPKPPGADELIVRSIGANDSWDKLKNTHELVDLEAEKKRTLTGGEDWWKFENPRAIAVREMIDPSFIPPMPIERLSGEIPQALAGSHTHAVCVTAGGDIYVWGSPEGGMLGLGGVIEYQEVPMLVRDIAAEKRVIQVASGLNHTACLCDDGEVLVWGFPGEGRLGLGDLVRFGPKVEMIDPKRRAGINPELDPLGVTVPVVINFFPSNKIFVKSVACGTAHTVAVTTRGVFAWGCNDGGRLGVGDQKNRDMPTEVAGLRGMHVRQVSCATWHSAALVVVPPLVSGGWVYTWGRGMYGQLGLGNRVRQSDSPRLVEELIEQEQVVTQVSCGVFHTGALTDEGEVWTWGKNDFSCLGRPGSIRDLGNPVFASLPGRFESMREYGVGPIVSLACGNKITIIATAPCKPLPPAKVRERARLDLAREKQSEALYERAHDELANAAAEAHKERQKARLKELNLSRPLCAKCIKCEGFQPQLFRPMICEMCGHDRKSHTKQRVQLRGAKDGKRK